MSNFWFGLNLAGVALGLAAASAAAQPMRQEFCTSGFSAFGIISDLPVYDAGDQQIGTTADLLIKANGVVQTLAIDTDFMSSKSLYLPWTEVEVGETWVRALAPGAEALLETDAGLASAQELIGSFVSTSGNRGLTQLGVVDDLLIDVDKIRAVVVRPNLGLGFAAKYAVPFDLATLNDPDQAHLGIDLSFEGDEVKDIGAFEC